MSNNRLEKLKKFITPKLLKVLIGIVFIIGFLLAIGATELASFIISVMVWVVTYVGLLSIWFILTEERKWKPSGCAFDVISFFVILMIIPIVAGVVTVLIISWLGLPWPFEYFTDYDYPERGTGPFRW